MSPCGLRRGHFCSSKGGDTLPTAKKIETVSELRDLFQRAKLTIATDYRGLNTAELTALRRRLREARVEFHVVKNTLASRAAEQAQRPALPELLTGPTALALGFGDEVEAAKSLTDYIRTSRINLPIRGGVLGERVLGAGEVQSLATLPGREVLLAQFMGGLNAPVTGLVTVLKALLSGFVRVLDARAGQLAEGRPLPAAQAPVDSSPAASTEPAEAAPDGARAPVAEATEESREPPSQDGPAGGSTA